MPWLIGLYTLVKLGDLIWRRKQLHLGQRPVDTLLLLLELAAGLLAPLGLFLSRRLRRSPRGLFVASLLVVGGVMLNRVNVFLVSYIPPFTRKRYYPSPAEIGLTLSTICAVILLYRFFVLQSPVLGFTRKTALPAVAEPSAKPVRRWWNRALQAAAFLLVLAFVFYYARVHRRALSGAQDKPWKAQAVQIREQFPQRPLLARNALYPLKYQLVYRLSDPLLHAPRAVYQAVEFSHGRHDCYVAGNCSLCHHRVSFSPSDRSGETISGLHRAIGVDPQGACSGCHADMRNKTFQKCSACHRLANEPDNPLRVGLRAAYHIACLGCHSRQSPSSAAPQRCDACHAASRRLNNFSSINPKNK